uniref:Anaphase-promoting complex subunit 4 WD40 domain-containing protein n=1 Tax=Glossina pallidipes TaxID=7398 RepID=A0A1B0AAG5_GLOPL
MVLDAIASKSSTTLIAVRNHAGIYTRTYDFHEEEKGLGRQLAWHPNGDIVAVALSGCCVKVFDLVAQELVQLYQLYSEPESSGTICPSGNGGITVLLACRSLVLCLVFIAFIHTTDSRPSLNSLISDVSVMLPMDNATALATLVLPPAPPSSQVVQSCIRPIEHFFVISMLQYPNHILLILQNMTIKNNVIPKMQRKQTKENKQKDDTVWIKWQQVVIDYEKGSSDV